MRIKNLMKLSFTLLFLAVFSLSWAFSAAMSPASKGNQKKGRYYFRTTCKTCHGKGDAGGEITPLSKTMAQWERYFERGKHNKRAELLDDVMKPEQIVDVGAYLVEHAADSLQPETCGD